MITAFKEWSYIVDALGKGRQNIILRKGGIAEDGGDFGIKAKKFLLFPTQFHQAEQMLKESWLPALDGNRFYREEGKVSLEYFAELADSKLVTDWNVLVKLDPFHAWKEEVVKERFERWQRNVHVLIVQIHKLDTPYTLEVLPEHGGCKSWIELDIPLQLEGQTVVNKMFK